MIPSPNLQKLRRYLERGPVQALVSSNQCKTGICKNYHWDGDDNDFFASISIQEILDQNVKVNNNFPSISKFPVNKQITQARPLILLIFLYAYLFDWVISVGFQTANVKKKTILEEGQKSVQNVITEFQGCLHEKDYGTGLKDIKDRMESSAQVDKVEKTTDFQTANGKNVPSEKGKKLVEGYLNEFRQSESDDDIENNKILSKKQSVLPEKKILTHL
uniref:Uncharacterized protein n=1 Tax=Glossina pallidipes TaxID=7398 RepID=A0A1B0AFK8_GLOPL